MLCMVLYLRQLDAAHNVQVGLAFQIRERRKLRLSWLSM
jgi:hypothetical protein